MNNVNTSPDDSNTSYKVQPSPKRDQTNAGLASGTTQTKTGGKDFKKVFSDKDSVKSTDKKGVQSNQKTEDDSTEVDVDPDSVGAQTATKPSDLYKDMLKNRMGGKKSLDAEPSSDMAGLSVKGKGEKKMGTSISKDSQNDMSSVNPGMNTTPVLAVNAAVKNDMATERTTYETRMAAVAKIEELMKTIVDQVNIIKQNGITYTQVEIKNLANFEGAKLTLSNYDTDTKSFNISFTNLSNAAKELVDANQIDLRKMLETRHGFTVHIIVATTQDERVIPSANSQQSNKEQDTADRDQKRRKQEKEEEQ
jgi:hypothetical protein